MSLHADSLQPNAHYGEDYFAWQRALGEFGGVAELIKFQDVVKPGDNVLEFGCGGGYLLSNLRCGARFGIEVNPVARRNCERLGVPAVENVAQAPDAWADVVISNHALEHVDDPMGVLTALRAKMKPNASIVLFVPCEAVTTRYAAGDINQHLFTWSPANLGCLFTRAGYRVESCAPYWHRWPPASRMLQKIVGWKAFHSVCWTYGFLFRRLSQVRAVATAGDGRPEPQV